MLALSLPCQCIRCGTGTAVKRYGVVVDISEKNYLLFLSSRLPTKKALYREKSAHLRPSAGCCLCCRLPQVNVSAIVPLALNKKLYHSVAEHKCAMSTCAAQRSSSSYCAREKQPSCIASARVYSAVSFRLRIFPKSCKVNGGLLNIAPVHNTYAPYRKSYHPDLTTALCYLCTDAARARLLALRAAGRLSCYVKPICRQPHLPSVWHPQIPQCQEGRSCALILPVSAIAAPRRTATTAPSPQRHESCQR